MTRGYCTGWRSCQTVKSSADYLSHETSEHPATSARDLSRSLTSAVLISARTISLEMSWGQRNSLMDLLPTTTLQRSASASCLYIPTLPSPTSVLYSLFSLSPSASQPLPCLSSPFCHNRFQHGAHLPSPAGVGCHALITRRNMASSDTWHKLIADREPGQSFPFRRQARGALGRGLLLLHFWEFFPSNPPPTTT